MERFTRLEAIAAPLDLPDVDTDRILPARFLRHSRDAGYGRYLFHDLRHPPERSGGPVFVLDQVGFRDARVLVAAENFGCGSSREGAVWALADHGIRAVIAPSFGDIFAQNALQNGMLTVVLPSPVVRALRADLHRSPGARVVVDLPAQTVTGPDGVVHRFDVDPFRKECLIAGQDDIALTLGHAEAIRAHERRIQVERPWVGDLPP